MDSPVDFQPNTSVDNTADIIVAYVSGNHVKVSEIPALIANVYSALSILHIGPPAEPAGPEKPTPAQIRKSISPDALISFIDSKPYKSIKRHLNKHGLSLEGYRKLYGLPADYPSTAPSYSAKRSELAHSFGLGRQRRMAGEVSKITRKTPETRGQKEAAETA